MRFLVVIETQKVKSYLFASPFMRETRGASVLLDWLNRVQTRELLHTFSPGSYEEVYLGGGSGRVLFEYETDAAKFRDAVLGRYREETSGARVAVEVVERKAGPGGSEPFSDWVRRGVGLTQQHKLGRAESMAAIGGRWLRPCSSCGQATAEVMFPEHGEHRLCRSCMRKRVEVNKLYGAVKPKGRGVPLKSESELSAMYSNEFIFTTLAYYCEADRFQALMPQDFEDIGDCSHPSNYMGFIYADGNRMGETVKKIGEMFPRDEEAKQAYGAFSKIVDRATRQAAVEAVLDKVAFCRPDDKRERFIPAEFIMAGGDDLMLVVPAQHALDVTLEFMGRYRRKTATFQEEYVRSGELARPFAPDGLSTSAGVVLAHVHYPASDLMTLAGQLMKGAKSQSAARAKANEEVNTLDFMILSEAGSEPVKERRRQEYIRRANGKYYRLTERPYTAEDAALLLDLIRKMKAQGNPRNKVKALYASLFGNPAQAQFDGMVIRERLKATGVLNGSDPMDELFKDLRRFPFRICDDGNFSTPLSEIAELYDFVRSPVKAGVVQSNAAHAEEVSNA